MPDGTFGNCSQVWQMLNVAGLPILIVSSVNARPVNLHYETVRSLPKETQGTGA